MPSRVVVPRYKATTDAQREALEEAGMIAEWARETDAEWVRAIAALSEVFAGTEHAATLDAQVATLAAGLMQARGEPWSEIEAVIRQLRERGLYQAAYAAARAANDARGDSSWLASVCANCAAVVGDLHGALRYIRQSAEQLEAENHPDAVRGWQAVIVRAEIVGDQASVTVAKERIARLTAGTPS